jgi:YidC/Oxa1 family membrane protein insertase
VLSVVYGLFVLPTINGHANGLLTERLFGANLGISLVGLLTRGAVGPDLFVFACLLAATLYLAVTTAWTLAERVVLRRRFAAA